MTTEAAQIENEIGALKARIEKIKQWQTQSHFLTFQSNFELHANRDRLEWQIDALEKKTPRNFR